jgi:hypothetical protein
MEIGQYSRKYGTSPIFRTYNTSAISAGGFFVHDFEISTAASEKYFPLNYLKITLNDNSNPMLLYINGDKTATDYIAPGTFISYDKDSIPAFRSVKLENIGSGEIAINAVQIVAQRVAVTTQDIAQTAHKAILTKKMPGVI